jgi:hypothetical protein
MSKLFGRRGNSHNVPAPIVLGVLALMLTTSFAFLGAPRLSAATPNLTVSSQTNTGTTLTGYWVEVTNSSGGVVGTGFTPASFTLAAGTYDVSVGDYSGEYFSHYSDGTTTRVHAVTLTSTGPAVALTAIYCPLAGCGGSSILVSSEYSTGAALTGMYVVLASGGVTVASGFTPESFPTTSGQVYTVTVDDYTGAYFYQWTSGTTTRTISVTADSAQTSLTAEYCATSGGCTAPPAGSSIEVSSEYVGGAALTGMYTVLEQAGTVVGTGFTPVVFPTTSGVSYSVIISDYTNAYFSEWTNGITTNTIDVTAGTSQTPLTAEFCTTACTATGSTKNTITVTSSDLHNGTTITGMYVNLRLNDNDVAAGFTPVTFTGLQTGVDYLVVVYWYGDYYFRHFSNGNLERYAYVTLNTTAGQGNYSMNALYEAVPKADAASLNIIAQFPNGTQIGTASVIGGYPQHTPGIYLTVTPPGATAPFTATFTGGSILPFILFNGETYVVAMSSSFSNVTFTRWTDNNSTDPTRSFTLDGNATYIAIYTQS